MSNPETRFSSAHAINTCIPLFFCRTQNTFSSIPVAAQCFQVADEALVFCPFHGRAFEEHPITLHVQCHPVLLLHLQQFGTGSEGRFRGGRCGAQVRTGTQATVATVEIRIHPSSRLFGNPAPVLDGQVAQAAADIQSASFFQGLCGAGFDTTAASAATVGGERRIVGIRRQVEH